MKKDDLKKIFPALSDEQQKFIGKLEKDAYDQGRKEAEVDFKKAEFERELNNALIKAAAKNVKALKALLDIGNISLEDGKLTGLSEQLEKIRKDNGYLFEDGGDKPEFTSPNKSVQTMTSKDFESMSYKKRLKLFRENPDLYHQMSR